MHRTLRLGLVFLFAALCAANAQPQPGLPTISVAHSVVQLPGPWRFQPGDSPAWSSPTFDDSSWALMDLHADNATNPTYGSSGYIKGWTARGYPLLSGFAWYRLRIHIADPATPLALKMPDAVDDAYQVFANGQLLGSFGIFKAKDVVAYRSRPLTFQLPPPDAHGDILLAFRFFAEPFVIADGSSPFSGGMHQVPLIGLPAEIQAIHDHERSVRTLSLTGRFFFALFGLLAATGAFWLWLLDRPNHTYFWLTLSLFFGVASGLNNIAAVSTAAIDQDIASGLGLTLTTLSRLCWILFWRDWFQLSITRTIKSTLATLGIIIMAIDVLGNTQLGISSQTTLHLIQFRTVCDAALGAMILASLVQGARRDRAGALLALAPILLLEISNFGNELLNWAGIRTTIFPAGIEFGLGEMSGLLLVIVIGALVARRFLASQVAQTLARQSIDLDLEQARVLQQSVLAPEPIHSALFTVESVYRPSRTVGGDFFQVLPGRVGSVHEGSLLIVLGDVSGKGMAAAMLVAVLVGAIRSEADHTFDPAAILHTLNQRLLGRAGGHFATCIAACLLPDGTMLIANAGHIPPYVNGRAMELAGSLPVGLDPDATYDVEAIDLSPADRLIFLTDGVPEARNPAGDLLGFEATEDLTTLAPGRIADAAIAYGQDDDITILSIALAAEPVAV